MTTDDPRYGEALERQMLPKEVAPIPMPAEPNVDTEPVAYVPPKYQRPGGDRDVMTAAAVAYDRAQKIQDELREQLDKAILNLEGKNNRILQLETQLAEERNRVSSYQGERDQAIAERAAVESFLASIRGLLDHLTTSLAKFELPAPVKRGRARRNAVADNSAIANISGAQGEVPNGSGSTEPLPG